MLIYCNFLVYIGRHWLARVWLENGQDVVARKKICEFFNDQLKHLGFRLNRGWQQHDPVIYPHKRKARRYLDIAYELDSNPVENAKYMLKFLKNEIPLEYLNSSLQEICLIVCVAEVGRGYVSALDNELIPFLMSIIQKENRWVNIKVNFSPALTYAEDSRMDYKPNEEDNRIDFEPED
jgi:hypothetical protein